ncbi:terminase large subunit domain-containing protein [Actinomadura rupiterrae]|uniref:terminase large subunit domain-containing protein n=1 Tax=Actinomadura rupiterrae TaxID=559627 RepID=UPI0020A4F44C|nr:terminase large subunit [Actinomadura rupiterrae]MCP2339177.1 hypothetical protein [Actinomadura rupiterrae]
MPWQRHVADVILEVDPVTGLLAYREVVLTVPRQSGKTTLLLALMVHRALGFGSRQNILYSAQTRGAARKKWEDEHLVALEASPLRSLYRVRRQLGQEAFRWRNGSIHGLTSNTEKAGHGETLDLGVIDEAFAQEDDRLEQAFKPAMITRPQPQQVVISTAGTMRSVFLRGKVDAGRRRCEAGGHSAVAYFEWSAPNDADPADPATWWECMPALGHTVTEAAVRADFESMKLPEFRRAYLNQWPDAAPDQWLVLGRDAWMDLVATLPDPDLMAPVAFSVDVTPERSHASIGVAGRREGLTLVEVAEHRRGTGWVVPRLVEMCERWGPCAVVIDAAGPAGSLIPDLEAAGVAVTKPSMRDLTQACGGFIDAARPQDGPPTLRHAGQRALDEAVAGAVRRSLGDAWAWSRRSSAVDISPLVAVTLAAWGRSKFGAKAGAVNVMENVW